LPFTLEKIKRKERIFLGDRNFEDLILIDSYKNSKEFTYPGWEKDLEDAERSFIEFGGVGKEYLERMKKKESIHLGIVKKNKYLVKLDKLEEAGKLTYPNWKYDVDRANNIAHDSIKSDVKLILKRQAFHNGDKEKYTDYSKLRQFTKKFDYPGWEQDFQEAEKYILYSSSNKSKDHVKHMKRKQAAHMNDRSNKFFVKIDNLKLTLNYPNFLIDLMDAENAYLNPHISYPPAKQHLKIISRKKDFYSGDRRHKDLVKLDEKIKSNIYTYPGFKEDVDAAEKSYLKNYYSFDFHYILKGMDAKQLLFEKGYLDEDHNSDAEKNTLKIPNFYDDETLL